METPEYIENLEATLIDILPAINCGESELWRNLFNMSSLSQERCREIQDFFINYVKPRYLGKHNIG